MADTDAIVLQHRRGTSAEVDAFTGAEGEITYSTDTHELRTHDGVTAGGHKLARDTSVVHKADAETITGDKTFTGAIVKQDSGTNGSAGDFTIQDTSLDRGTTASADHYHSMRVLDKKGNRYASFSNGVYANGSVDARLYAYGQGTDSPTSASVGVVVSKAGVAYGTAPTTPATADGNEIVTADFFNAAVGALSAIPVGTIMYYAYETPPEGFLVCNGATVSSATYPALYKALHGIPDVMTLAPDPGAGSEGTYQPLFALPDLIDCFPEGATSSIGAFVAAGLPDITGGAYKGSSKNDTSTDHGLFDGAYGAFRTLGVRSRKTFSCTTGTYAMGNGIVFDAKFSNTIYGRSTTVQPQATLLLPIIKY